MRVHLAHTGIDEALILIDMGYAHVVPEKLLKKGKVEEYKILLGKKREGAEGGTTQEHGTLQATFDSKVA